MATSVVDVSQDNADFDTRLFSPRTRNATPATARNASKTPASARPHPPTPGLTATSAFLHNASGRPNHSRKPRIYRGFTVSSTPSGRPFRRAAPSPKNALTGSAAPKCATSSAETRRPGRSTARSPHWSTPAAFTATTAMTPPAAPPRSGSRSSKPADRNFGRFGRTSSTRQTTTTPPTSMTCPARQTPANTECNDTNPT